MKSASPPMVLPALELHSILNLDDHYIQTADITLIAPNWSPIGTSAHPFTGSFHGNGYTINDLTINRSNHDNVGLFGVTGNDALLKIMLAAWSGDQITFPGRKIIVIFCTAMPPEM